MPMPVEPQTALLYNIQTIQRRGYIEAQIDGTPLVGRMRREEIVEGRRYIAVRWRGEGTAVYLAIGSVVQNPLGDTFTDCKLIHWGL